MTIEHIKKRWAEIKAWASQLWNAFQERFNSGAPASTVLNGSRHLPLNLQFFADPGDPPGNDPKDPPANTDELTLAELLKTNPKINAEYKTKVEAAINKRFKSYDFDPEEAKVAIQEKKDRDANKGAEDAIVQAKIDGLEGKLAKLQDKAKQLAVETFAAANGLDAKLFTRLAGQEIAALKLDDNFDLDKEELDDVVNTLRADFPQIFTTPDPNNQQQQQQEPPPPNTTKVYNGGSTQRTNTPPPPGGKDDEAIKAEMKETLERLNKAGRLKA